MFVLALRYLLISPEEFLLFLMKYIELRVCAHIYFIRFFSDYSKKGNVYIYIESPKREIHILLP